MYDWFRTRRAIGPAARRTAVLHLMADRGLSPSADGLAGQIRLDASPSGLCHLGVSARQGCGCGAEGHCGQSCRGGKQSYRVAALTMAPGPDVAHYHDRQIVILPPRAGVHWLDLSAPEDLMLRPSPLGSLFVERVYP